MTAASPEPGGDCVRVPICVDLDGTLIRSKMLHEALKLTARENPTRLLSFVPALLGGRARFKRRVAEAVDLDPSRLACHTVLLDELQRERTRGRGVILVTGSDRADAARIARHFQLFDEIFASDGRINLTGGNKARLLVDLFGERGYDYVGNDWKDVAVWRRARAAWVVSGDPRLLAVVKRSSRLERVLPWT